MRELARPLLAAMLIGGVATSPALAQPDPAAVGGQAGVEALGSEAPAPAEPPHVLSSPSRQAWEVMDWVVSSGDNGSLPFIVIDKVAAAVFVFDPSGELVDAAPALLGIATGDDSTPGVGDRNLAEIGPAERTTPAGRFAAHIGPAYGGHQVLWVDFADSVALHPVVTSNPRERRLQRIQSPTPDDNRITFGCINVPTAFYRTVVQPLFAESGGIVYILPETRPAESVFPGMRIGAGAPLEVALDKPPPPPPPSRPRHRTFFSLGR